MTRLLFVRPFALACAAALTFSSTVCEAGTISARGSDSTIKVVKALADAYQEKTGQQFAIDGGGSSTGAKSALAGEIDLAFLSRDLKAKEIESGLIAVPYAHDGVVVIINKNNPSTDLSLEQIKGLYTGEATAWDNGKPIMALGRPEGSGTRECFQKSVLGKGVEFGPKVKIKHHKAALSTVSKAVTAVAYTSLGALGGSEAVAIVRVEGVVPSTKTVQDGTYPISRTLNFATKGEPSSEVVDFLSFVTSEEGQGIVKAVGFVTLADESTQTASVETGE